MVNIDKRLHGVSVFLVLALLAACSPAAPLVVTPTPLLTMTSLPSSTPSPSPTRTFTPLPTNTPLPSLTPTPVPPVPNFDHIIIFMFENKEFSTVIGNSQMPSYNRWAGDYTLLTEHYAILHPSLPNYIALIGGDTFGIDTNTPKKIIDAPSLPDLIEASGRTWKTYQETMRQPCGLEDSLLYVRKHNPFIFFKSIRDNKERCQQSVVPLTELDNDLRNHTLPNFVFITPNLCNSAHDAYTDPLSCNLSVADAWLDSWLNTLMGYWPVADNGLIIVTWDEGQGDHTCCGLKTGGGRIPTMLISSKAKKGFLDNTQYTHYSILKTIAAAWGLPELGKAADPQNVLIEAPWVK